MIGAAVLAGLFAVTFIAFGLFVDGRALWWRFRAPRLDNPEAHEPSSASFTARRVIMVALGLFLAYESVSALRLAGVFDSGPDHDEILARVKDAALELETDEGDGRYKLSSLEGSWGDLINPLLEGPESWDPVATFVEDADAATSTPSAGGRGAESDLKAPFVERYEIDGSVCLTVTATPLPGQSRREHALDLVMYGIRTEVVDSPCPEGP